MAKTIHKSLTIKYSIRLPDGVISTGAGTVPTSNSSVNETSLSKMVTELRKASKEGIFDVNKEKDDTVNFAA